jgi:sugar phosphate isomerase/epimerase
MARVQYDPISYVLIHFPKPMILDPQLSWHHANFPEHHVLEPLDISYSDFATLAYDIIHQLDVLASVYNIPIMLELELFNTYIYETDLLDSILKNCQNVFLCVDTARMHVIEQIDENFDAIKFMDKHKSYIKHIHVSNLHFDEGIQKGHQPAEKHLNQEKGWADIESMLRAAKNNDPQSLLYEHDSRMLSCDALEGVYNWIEKSME